jgi:hypothetical protein
MKARATKLREAGSAVGRSKPATLLGDGFFVLHMVGQWWVGRHSTVCITHKLYGQHACLQIPLSDVEARGNESVVQHNPI